MATNQINSNNVREINQENLSVIREEAKTSFLTMIDSLISSENDNVEVSLKENDKAKIRKYYNKWQSETRETTKFIILGFLLFSLGLYSTPNFDLEALKDFSEVLSKGIPFLLLWAFTSLIFAFFMVEKNIENFFFHLYPQIADIQHRNKVAFEILNFVFTKNEQKTKDFKKFIIGFFVLFVLCFFVSNVKIFVFMVVFSWLALILTHEKTNNVFLMKGKK